MNLINRLTQKKKYEKSMIDVVTFKSEDFLTSSAENDMLMAQKPKIKDMEITEPLKREPTVFEKYPDGLPLEILELIDFKHFGAILKQKQLLPPSYDRKPVNVVFDEIWGYPRVILEFQSKTSDSVRFVGICRYSVVYSENKEDTYVLQVKPLMIAEWRKFAENVMWAWERGYNYALYGAEKRIETYRKPIVDKSTIIRLQEIESEGKNYCNFK